VLGEASLRGRRCRVSESIEIATEVLVFIKDYRGLVLRRGDLHHVACRIRSSSSGDVHRIIGRFLTGLTRCERSGQNSKDHRCDPYHVVSDYWVSHRECVRLIDQRIVLHLQFPDLI
jgi:hypothetical protein